MLHWTDPSRPYKSIFIALWKKPGATEFQQLCAIILMSHITKLPLHIIMTRVIDQKKAGTNFLTFLNALLKSE